MVVPPVTPTPALVVALGLATAPPVVPALVAMAVSEGIDEAIAVSEAIADGEAVACKALNKAAGEALALGEALAAAEALADGLGLAEDPEELLELEGALVGVVEGPVTPIPTGLVKALPCAPSVEATTYMILPDAGSTIKP